MIIRHFPSLEGAIEILHTAGYGRYETNKFKLNRQPTQSFPELVRVDVVDSNYPVEVKVSRIE